MRRTALTAAPAAGVVFAGVGPAVAQNAPGSVRDVPDTNQVVVFSNEVLPLEAYPDPHGCHRLPARHSRLVLHQRDRLVAAGMTDAELTEVREVMRHPRFRARSCVIYSVQGRRAR
ncbi:hypothetical protein ACFY0A_29440 [Streptomyces sp. NPDC001698]|uniref:hypothetical protein n=1 Tax=unclassified Streptomyces TaxID=2593676 RepID=UPI0036C93123